MKPGQEGRVMAAGEQPTPLHPEVLTYLERRGVEAARAALAATNARTLDVPQTSPASQSISGWIVRETDRGLWHITQREIETWLAQKDAAAQRQQTETATAAKSANLGAWAAVLVALAGVIAAIWFGLHPPK